MRRTAALIVGGGPAGAAAAITLARGGMRPLLLERQAAPRAIVCGGFLGWDAIATLERLGVDPWAAGAHPIERVRIVSQGTASEVALPARAAGISRAVLDEALLGVAADAGAEIVRGTAVRRIEGERAWTDQGPIAADALFVATGKHDLRGASARPGGSRGHIGLRATLAAPRGLAGTIELHPFEGGYAGLLVQEDGRANLCLSVAPDRFAAAGASPIALAAALATTAPQLAALIAQVEEDWAAIAGVPYGWRIGRGQAGRFHVGDQAAVIASVVGDGIAMALTGGIRAGEALLATGPSGSASFQRRDRCRVGRAIRVAEVARKVAENPRLARAVPGVAARLPGMIGLVARLTRSR